MAHRGLTPNHRRRRLLRACRERPCRRAAECGQQFPPSDGGCHTPLPCEVRKGNDTTPRACSLAVQGGQNAGCCRPASGSKAERLSFPLCPRKRTYLPILELLPPPALRERCHGGLARRGITVRRRAVFVMPERKRPQPRLIYRRSVGLHDAADHRAIGRHVVIVIISTRPDGREADARLPFSICRTAAAGAYSANVQRLQKRSAPAIAVRRGRVTNRTDCSGSEDRMAPAAATGASPHARPCFAPRSKASNTGPQGRRNR